MTLMTKKQNYQALMISAVTVLLFSTPIFASAFVQVINGQAGLGADRQWVNGEIQISTLPTAGGSWHKDYMVYVTDPWTEFIAGSGIYLQRTGGSVTDCHLKLYVNDGESPATNFHYVDCSPGPGTSAATAIVFQEENDGTEWTGQSEGNEQTYDFVNSADDPNIGGLQGSKNPAYWGYVAGSTADDDDLYSNAFDLETKKWGGSLESFSSSGANDKCYRDTGYKLEFVSDVDDVETGPPTATDECSTNQQDYGPYGGEWR